MPLSIAIITVEMARNGRAIRQQARSIERFQAGRGEAESTENDLARRVNDFIPNLVRVVGRSALGRGDRKAQA